VPEVARACLAALGTQLLALKEQILEFDRMILTWHRSNQTSKRLHYIPGVGPMLATALVASVADPRTFRSGRNFSAWIGLVPKQHSSGGKQLLGSISKQGDRRDAGINYEKPLPALCREADEDGLAQLYPAALRWWPVLCRPLETS
jgi:transposase